MKHEQSCQRSFVESKSQLETFFKCVVICFQQLLRGWNCRPPFILLIKYTIQVTKTTPDPVIKNKNPRLSPGVLLCRGGRIRTCGPLVPNQVRYRTAPRPELFSRNLLIPLFLILLSSRTASALVFLSVCHTSFHGIPFRVNTPSPLLCRFSLSSKSFVLPT